MVLHAKIRISRDAFAAAYRKGWVQRSQERLKLFGSDPDSGLTVRQDARLVKGRAAGNGVVVLVQFNIFNRRHNGWGSVSFWRGLDFLVFFPLV